MSEFRPTDAELMQSVDWLASPEAGLKLTAEYLSPVSDAIKLARKQAATIAELKEERDQLTEQLAIRSESGMAKDMQEIMRINNELNARITELEAENEEHRNQIVSLQNQMFKERNVLTAERQRREIAEADRRELLMMLSARPDITSLFGFKEKQIFEAARERNNSRYAHADDSGEKQ